MNDNLSFGAQLRALRQNRGLSLRELGIMTNFNFAYLAQCERGARSGSAVLANKADAALGADGALIAAFAATKAAAPVSADALARQANELLFDLNTRGRDVSVTELLGRAHELLEAIDDRIAALESERGR